MRPTRGVILALALTAASLQAADEPPAAVDYPRHTQFRFEATRNSLPIRGSFRVEFKSLPDEPELRLMVMKGLAGLGGRSSEVLYSAVARDDLSLRYATVMPFEGARADQMTSQLTLEACRSVMEGVQRFCFVHRQARGAEMQTEFFTPYPGVDFLSSMLVAARMVAQGPARREFNFVQGTTSTQVALTVEPAPDQDPTAPVPVVARPLAGGTAIYTLMVSRDSRGTWVSRLTLQSDEASLDAVADAPTW